MSVHEIGVFRGKEYPFLTLLGSSFLLDDVLYGPAHQAGPSCHQHSHRRGVIALVAHLVRRAREPEGQKKTKHVNVLIFASVKEAAAHKELLSVILTGA